MARPRLLSRERVITRDVLREIAESRLDEAKALLDTGHFGAGVYLAGYAVECYLKVAVCFTLRWDALLATFRVHDLEGLLLYSGFDRELRANTRVYDNFAKVQAIWKMEGGIRSSSVTVLKLEMSPVRHSHALSPSPSRA